ncbi:uncharacterized protein [Euwallacea similis]|uniref:uncharacterized protein n=1 Tax=Euwallacea similis TaxID=1736056 RepID=UPI00344BCFEE
MRLKVIVRVRPLSQREKQSGGQHVVSVENGSNIAVTNVKVPEQHAGDSRERVRRFAFDYCLSEDANQDQVFETVEEIVGTSLRNRNHSCVLAYGQTSSGKTHTMMGFPHDPGLTPRLCHHIFKYFEDGALSIEAMKVSVSYLEIYNEKVADLLSDIEKKGQERPLRVREHPKRGPYVEGLSQHLVTTDTELLERLEAGTNRRRVGFTATNPRSSRSHSVFSVSSDDGVKLHLVDLAGNERAGSRGYGPNRFREGANINKSLVALGNVISTLADYSRGFAHSRNKFVPYRDSVLTWLLKDTLQGNSNTVMVATVSPSSQCYSETVNTLRFGQRAKLIVYKPVIVEDSKERTIRELRAEIAQLRDLLMLSSLPRQREFETSQEDYQVLISKSDTLVPIMNVETSQKTKKVDRSYSIDTDNKSFSSQESLQSPKHGTSSSASSARRMSSGSSGPPSVQPKQTALSLKRQSLNRSSPLLKTITQKKLMPEKNFADRGVVTELSGVKKSERKQAQIASNDKPRAQIVAAVTSRLYNKVKKQDIGTSTENLPAAKELSICSNARNRLRELTQKALKAHRSRNEETQTELFPVLRVKEAATDCLDLKVELCEVKDVATSMENCGKDVAIECTLLNQFIEGTLRDVLIVTRSCGIQTISSEDKMSFTKYLLADKNPIFTEAVNINISHNYASSNQSEDSLEGLVSFPTPDLISNHNSLEPCQEKVADIAQVNFETANYIPAEKVCASTARVLTEPEHREKINNVEVLTTHALQGFIQDCKDTCKSLPDFCPNFAKAKLSRQPENYSRSRAFNTQTHFDHVRSSSSSSNSSSLSNIPDSLDYHLANQKKVQFSRKTLQKSDRLMNAMKEFLQEAKLLMTNLSRAGASHCQQPHLDDFDIQVTLNDVSGLDNLPRKRKKKLKSTQTCPMTTSSSSQTSLFGDTPLNKYEALLEDSCKRLEEKINKPPRSWQISIASEDFEDELLFEKPRYNPWDLSNVEVEDSSLESQPVTFSDYGSLPRKTHKRQRTPTCSPSAFLKQLTQMRRQIIENSREELMVQSCSK